MELIFEMPVTIGQQDVDSGGCLKLSALLYYAQETAGGHCKQLGLDWDTMNEKGLFWAVLRHRVLIHRLPKLQEQVTFRTWPMPTTRVAYPRCVQALDSQGNVLFDAVSLWVIMDKEKRSMLLPGKSNVEVPGILRGCEPEAPNSLTPGSHEQEKLWTVTEQDLDVNGHVNNAKYLDHIQDLIDGKTPKELVVCYLAETRLQQSITLQWSLSDDGVLSVDGCRPRTDVPERTERVFAARVIC